MDQRLVFDIFDGRNRTNWLGASKYCGQPLHNHSAQLDLRLALSSCQVISDSIFYQASRKK